MELRRTEKSGKDEAGRDIYLFTYAKIEKDFDDKEVEIPRSEPRCKEDILIDREAIVNRIAMNQQALAKIDELLAEIDKLEA